MSDREGPVTQMNLSLLRDKSQISHVMGLPLNHAYMKCSHSVSFSRNNIKYLFIV